MEKVEELADCGKEKLLSVYLVPVGRQGDGVCAPSLAVFALAKDDRTVRLLVTSSTKSVVFLCRCQHPSTA